MNKEATGCMTFAEWYNGGRHRPDKYIPTPVSYYKEEAERHEKRQTARKFLEELKEQYSVLRAL